MLFGHVQHDLEWNLEISKWSFDTLTLSIMILEYCDDFIKLCILRSASIFFGILLFLVGTTFMQFPMVNVDCKMFPFSPTMTLSSSLSSNAPYLFAIGVVRSVSRFASPGFFSRLGGILPGRDPFLTTIFMPNMLIGLI